MDAVRAVICFGYIALAVGCSSTSTTKLGGSSTLKADFPNGARSQAPAEPVAPQTPPETVAKGEDRIRVVAVIGADAVITDDEVWGLVRHRTPEYIKLTGTERSTKEKELFKEELRRLIERELILAEMMGRIRKNKPGVEEELKDLARKEADKRILAFRQAIGAKNDDEVKEALSQMGQTPSGIRRQFERDSMVDLLIGPQLREKSKNITLAEIREYYDRNPKDFTTIDRVKWLDMFVSSRRFRTPEEAKQYAEQLRAKVVAGADFVAVVKDFGQGDSSLRNGEGIGEKKGEIQPKELEATLFSMKAGEMSQVVASNTGYHVVKVLERDVAGLKPFDEKTQQVCKNILMMKVMLREKEKLIDELWRKYKPTVTELP